MTVTNTSSRTTTYVGNGSASQFAVTMPFRLSSDLKVFVADADNVETVLTLSTHYTVSTSGKSVSLVSGSFPFLDTNGKLKTGYKLFIRRILPLRQDTSIKNLGAFFPQVHEDAFDYLMEVDQQQQDEISRAVKLPETILSSAFNPHLPYNIVGKQSQTLVTNPDGSGFALGPSISDLNYANAQAAAAVAAATAASGSATAANLSKVAAALSESHAATSEGNASNSANAAATSAGNAAASATAAGTSASSAATSATVAAAGSLKVVGTVAAPVAIANTGYTFDTSTPELEQLVYVKSNGGSVDVTANPQVTAGNKVGQILELHGTSNTDELRFTHGRGLVMNGEYYLGQASVISFRWNGSVWCERFRNGVTKQ